MSFRVDDEGQIISTAIVQAAAVDSARARILSQATGLVAAATEEDLAAPCKATKQLQYRDERPCADGPW
ncbi:hypothetical protein [Arthrobacter sp. ISL-65]|uniref:hypothetical protein n=1 Tax=Arthrobacter sp. ISL-65 TaxID=2819112 RepID=UPI001BEAF7E1|nr:hypothetical protein [Arthrobacter sp. ISL-65]MBT2548049.1 hypothetical protein [Arthrobacter sp. ISL-65]